MNFPGKSEGWAGFENDPALVSHRRANEIKKNKVNPKTKRRKNHDENDENREILPSNCSPSLISAPCLAVR